MDFLSGHYLCVKFSMCLMHNIHSLIHIQKSIQKVIFKQIIANKINSEKMLIIFSAQYLETMVTYNNQIRLLKFVTLYS